MKAQPSQGRRLIMLLKRRPMTTMQMLQTGISVCPWKRIRECLREDERLIGVPTFWATTMRPINFYRVVKATKFTA
jgi:hypothetical protein